MRDFKNMKRQRGRNRGGGGGSGKPQQNANRAFDSNGPDNVKIRGHAQHVFEKYQQLARDAFSSGDRVLAENYLQHADHYFRVLRTIQPQRSPSEILGRDVLASGLDIDFEEEFEAPAEDVPDGSAEAMGEATNGDARNGGEPRGDGQRYEGRRDDRYERDGRRESYQGRSDREPRSTDRYEPRREGEGGYRDRPDNREGGGYRDRTENRDRDNTNNRDRYEGRDNRDRSNRDQQEWRDRPDRGEGRDRFEGRRDSGARRFEGRREERPYSRENRYEDRPASDASDTAPAAAAPEAMSSAPPSTPAEADASAVLRSQDGGMSEAPAFLQASGGEEERKPRVRRRRAPRSFDPSEDGDASAADPVAEDA